ncbi:MAG: BspA family leucine-rich repeat surface protein [Chitinophagaceae bacterium]|nr:BspA family leucine-rich repeat surface protein [Chitinophagaceae bacterium]
MERITTILIILFTTLGQIKAQPFITKWDMSIPGGAATSIAFLVSTTGTVNYTWETVPSGQSGSGTFSGTSCTISGLPAGSIIRLSIDTTNFRQFKMSPNYQARLIAIEQWGGVNWTSFEFAFSDCSNLDCIAPDLPNLSQVSNLSFMFKNCISLVGNSNIGNWNIQNVTNLNGMFYGAVNFNQPIANWNTQNVTDMSSMFQYDSSFNQPIGNWNTQNVTNMAYMFCNASNFNQSIGIWSTQNVISMRGMLFRAQNFNQPIGNWNTQNVTDMGFMFAEATSFNQPIGYWNTQNVKNMDNMFAGASNFNQPIGNWNTLNVENMSGMFLGATSFNEPIGNWNTQNLIYTEGMFNGAINFNQPIGNWNTGNVYFMQSMFKNATSFNQPIGNWNTQNVHNTKSMFEGASSFNQPIGNWNTADVSDMNSMFMNAISFNQPLGNWNTADVNDMSSMFEGAQSFNQPLANWFTGSVYSMERMFYNATAFNQPIGNWSTGNVNSMKEMFCNATAFNQVITTWNVQNVTTMFSMLHNAANFNQSLGSWLLASNVNLINIFSDCGMDCDNYSATLCGWGANPNIPNNLTMYALNRLYGTNAVNPRNFLINVKGWSISGDLATNTFCCQPSSYTTNETHCAPYNFNNQLLTSSGVYYDTLLNATGCDSFLTLNLTLLPSTNSSFNYDACPGYLFNGQHLYSNGIYLDTLVNSNGCDSIIAMNLNLIYVDTSVTQVGSALIANETGASYNWITCSLQPIPLNATSQSFTPGFIGFFAVVITKNGCTDTSSCHFYSGNLGSEEFQESSIIAYPNPCTERIHIITDHEVQSATISLYSMDGRLVKNLTNQSFREYVMDVSALARGNYWLKISSDKISWVKKIIKD